MKAIPNWEIQEIRDDPKPGELSMDRVKVDEIRLEARTRRCCKNVG